MARTRAIENGFSLVRSVRWGASAAFDPYGRVRGWMQSTEANDRVMVASVPIGRLHTPYTVLGESFALAAAAGLAAALAWSAWRVPPARPRCPTFPSAPGQRGAGRA
jgi:apolipoprotein N-acyltransferase